MFKGLKLFSKTSCKKTFNVASFHSPHSLTWSWILSFRRHEVIRPKFYARRSKDGIGAGFGTLISAYAYRTNNGLTWDVCLFWHGLHFTRQSPTWYRDMFWRADDEREELNRRVRQLERQIEAMPSAARSTSEVGVHLH